MSDPGEPRAANPASAVPKSANGDEIPQPVTKSDDLDALLAEVCRPDPWLAEALAEHAREVEEFLASLPPLDVEGLVDLADLDLPRLD
jgi:hypothetical protein